MEGEKKILVQLVNKLMVNGEEIGLPVGTTFPQLEFHMVDLERGECLHNYTPPLTKFVPAYTMASICDMVAVARFLNLTLLVPELDNSSFWADTIDFDDIFDVEHFVNSLRDEVRIIKRLPKRFNRKNGF